MSSNRGWRFPLRLRLMAAAGITVSLAAGLALQPEQPEAHPRQRLAAMSGHDLAELQNRQRRFEQMPELKQHRLREMHDRLQVHPRHEALMATLKRYYEWIKSLSAEDRAIIKSLSGDERLARIRDIRQQQAEQIFGIAGDTQLPRNDVSGLFEWNREFLAAKRDAMLALVRQRGSGGEGRSFRGFDESSRTDFLFFVLSRTDPDGAAALITEDDIDQLKKKLSPDAVTIIDDQQTLPERQKLVYRWVISAISAQLDPSIPDRELMDFYDTQMTSEQRQQVDAMTAENRRRTIARLYRMARRNDGRRPFGPPASETPETEKSDRSGQ